VSEGTTRVSIDFIRPDRVALIDKGESSAEVWDYSTLIPTVLPELGEQQDQRLSFDFMTTLVGTWKEFNMLFDGISLLGLDAPARDLMDRYVDRMREIQGILEVADGPNRPDLTYPRNLNYSISN